MFKIVTIHKHKLSVQNDTLTKGMSHVTNIFVELCYCDFFFWISNSPYQRDIPTEFYIVSLCN